MDPPQKNLGFSAGSVDFGIEKANRRDQAPAPKCTDQWVLTLLCLLFYDVIYYIYLSVEKWWHSEGSFLNPILKSSIRISARHKREVSPGKNDHPKGLEYLCGFVNVVPICT
jgi:hypothetical protein